MKSILVLRDSSKLSVIMALIGTLVLTSLQSFSQIPADFSGTWILNVAKSSPLPRFVSSTIVITQVQNEITLNITFVPKDSISIKRTDKYFIGSAISTRSTDKTRTLTSEWSPDKKTFSTTEIVINSKDGAKKESKRITTYSLTNKGKTLIIKTDDTLPDGSITSENARHSVSVYNKS
jgi:hypothetical protein